MSEAVNVRSVEAIDALRAALIVLREETHASVVVARLAARAQRAWLSERQQYWQQRVTRLAEELIEAEAALVRCKSQRQAAGSSGCQAIAAWTEQTRRALRQAEVELRTARHWGAVIDERIASFERRALMLTSELAHRVPSAVAELAHLVDLLEQYAER